MCYCLKLKLGSFCHLMMNDSARACARARHRVLPIDLVLRPPARAAAGSHEPLVEEVHETLGPRWLFHFCATAEGAVDWSPLPCASLASRIRRLDVLHPCIDASWPCCSA